MALVILLPESKQLWLGPVNQIERVESEVPIGLPYNDEAIIMAYDGVRPREYNDASVVPVLYRDSSGKLWVRFCSSGSYYVHAPVHIKEVVGKHRAVVNLWELAPPELD